MGQVIHDVDDLFQLGALLPQRLGALGIVPYIGDFQLPVDLGQALLAIGVVKGTPSDRRGDPAYP